MSYSIHPIVNGSKIFDKGMMTYQSGYGQRYTIPIYTWYIEGGKQNILVDTGEMHPVQSPDREEAIGGRIYTFEQGLDRYGLRPEDIDLVIHTHLHTDHCENDSKCTNAKFYCHKKELEHVHDPHPLDFRYFDEYIQDIQDNGQLQTIEQDGEILPGIKVIQTPIHTEGGLSVAIETDMGLAVITGFCVIDENFNPPAGLKAMEMEVIPPGTVVNTYQAYNTMLKIRDVADLLIPLHEPRFAGIDRIPD